MIDMARHQIKNGTRTRPRARVGPVYHDEAETGKAVGWMNGSPMATIGAIMAVIGLCTNIGTVGYIYASVVAEAAQLRKDVDRNFKEDDHHRERHIKNIERIDATIGNMNKLSTEMEVVKTKLDVLNDSVKDLKRTFERRPVDNHHKGK